MSNCGTGELSTIREPLTPDPCGCECDGDDIAYVGQSSECTGVLPNEKLNSVLNKILTKICDIDAEINITDIEWGCIPNAIAPTGGSVESNIQFIADELIPRSGNDCNCAITDDLYFADGKGIYQCPADQDSGSVYFSGDYAYLNAETQIRATGDLKVSSGFGAAYSERNASTDLSVTPTESLRYSYGIDANANNVTLTLPEIGDASGDHLNRRLSIRRLDCNIGFTGTLQAAGSDTIEGLTSITVPIGHAFTIQADAATNDWVIMSEYFGCDTLEAQANGDIYMANSLGVGDSSPDAKLDVVQGTASAITAIFENTGAASVDLVQIKRNGSTVDVIDEAGNFQAGGSNPAARIHATGSDNSSATFSLLAEGLAGEDFFWVGNSGGTVIRTGTDQRFTFTAGNLLVGTDAGAIRSFSIQSNYLTWTNTRHLTASINLSPQASASAAYYTISATGTDSSGTNALMIFDIANSYNLTGTATGNVYGIRYRPTVTSVLGVHYAFIAESGLSGFNKATPLSHLESGGSVGYKTLTITGDTTLTVAHHHILANATTGAINVTLPLASACTGREYFVKKIDAVANNVTITAASLIDSAGSKVLSNQYAFYRIISDGTTFWVTGNN